MSKPRTYDARHFKDFVPTQKGILSDLEREAKKKDIPIIGPVVGRLLYILAKAMRAKRVLELGTATGYSAIWLGSAIRPLGGQIISIEWDRATAVKARSNIRSAGLSSTVDIRQGDARVLIKTIPGKLDLIFLDVEKEMYSSLLDPCVKLLRPGGLMVFDNTAFKTAGDFLERSFEHRSLETVHLHCFIPGHDPDLDAITFCMRRESQKRKF